MDIGFSKNIGLGIAKQPNSARNLYVEAVLLLIVCVLFVWFIILPKKSVVQEKQDALIKLQEQSAKVKTQVATLQKLVKNLEGKKDDISLIDKALPLSLNMPQVEIMLTNMARSVNVTLGNIGLSGKPNTVASGDKQLLAAPFKPARTVQKMAGSISVVGNFNQLKTFIEKLESSGRLINISEIQMDSASEGQLNLRISISIYYFGA